MPKGIYNRKGRRSRFIDLTGQRFGDLVVVREVDKANNGQARWESLCKCGLTQVSYSAALRSGKTTRCRACAINIKGGQSKRPEYPSWKAMIYRCYRPDSSHFYLYGGRGITVCEKWRDDFWLFLEDVGPRPSSDHSLDRIDVNGSYEPGNVRWATPVVQTQNRRAQPKRLNFRDYQVRANMTANYPAKGELMGATYCCLGASAELGEMINKFKKIFRDQYGEITAGTKAILMDEIGDCLWYLSQLCTELEIDFSHIPVRNLTKLSDRKVRGVLQGDGDTR